MKKKTNNFKLGLLLALLMAFFATQNSWAATKTFIGTTNSVWTGNANNWSPSGVPTEDDDVIIPTGWNITTGNVIAAKTITINGNSTLTLGHTASIALAADGGITLNGTSELTMGAAALSIGSATYRGDIVMNDNSVLTTTTQTFQLSGTWLKGVNTTIDVSTPPNFSFLGTTALSLPETITDANDMTITKIGSTVTFNDDMTVAGNFSITAGTLNVGDYNFEVTGTTGISLGATLNGNYTDADITREFTGAITLAGTLNLSGPRISAGYNNTITANLSIAATGILTVNFSKTTFVGTLAGAGAGATINALGSFLHFDDVVTWTNLTYNFNSNTDVDFTAGGAQSIPVMSIKDLTLNDAQTYTLTGNITLAGNYTAANVAGTLDLATFELTVNGVFNTGAAFTTNPSNNACDLIINGPVTAWGLFTDANDVNLNLIIGGSGTITPATLPATIDALYSLSVNRNGANIQFAGGAAFAIGTTMTITSGTVTAENGQTFDVAGTVTVELNGTFVCNDASDVTLAGTLTGTGTIDADGVADEIIINSGSFTFTGNLITDNATILTFDGIAAVATLPSSVVNLAELRLLGGFNHVITLSNNLTLTAQLAATNLLTPGIYDLDGYDLTITGGIAATADGTIIATDGSTLIFGAAVDFTAIGITEDETTNLHFTGASSTTALSTAILECNNLTQEGANTVTLTATGLTVYGNLDVGAGCTFAKATFDLEVFGDFVSAGTVTINGATGTVTLHGQMSGTATGFTTGATTLLVVDGTSTQFILPFGITTLGTLTLDRPSGMKINANLTVGLAAGGTTDLVITNGDLDLNGYTLALSQATTYMSETSGNTIINTGNNSTGYITTRAAGTTNTNIIASGIGVSALTTAAADVVVRRYPVSIPVPGVGLSTNRVYYIAFTPGAISSTVTFLYDQTELYSSASDLELYTSTTLAMTTNTNQSDVSGASTTVTENSPVAGKGTVAVTLGANITTSGLYYALAAVPGDGGVMYTWNGGSEGYWGTSTNWSPNGTPSKVDQIVIGPSTVVLNGEGNIFECKTLHLNHPNATLKPFDNGLTGDNVSLRVNGNITLAAGAEILGVNGKGRINLIIGDGVTAGVSSTITVNNDYVATSGIWLNNLTVNAADVTFPAQYVRISGDVELLANCAVSGVYAEFWGGANALQTLTIPSSSDFVFTNARFDNNVKVTTASNFTLTNQILVKSGSQFATTNGTALFNTSVNANGYPWNVENGAILKFWNVEFNDNAGGFTFAPLGTVYIQGNFYQYGTEAFAPTSGTVIFQNTGQKEIVNTQLATDLVFYNLQVASGSTVVTSNSWNIFKEIDVKLNASMVAENGTISFTGTTPMYIKNASTHTLEFNNLTIDGGGDVYTSDSWTIRGNLNVTAGDGLFADNGTITFENTQEKTINNSGGAVTDLQFFKLLIADGSLLTTSTGHDFTIANNATNPTGSGIEVVGTGSFTPGASSSTVYFDAGIGVAAGYPKTITKSPSGTLEFGEIIINATPNNEVTTASDFEISGTVFTNSGAGGNFNATAGTITFSGNTDVVITSVSPAVTSFHSILTTDATDIDFPDAIQEIYIKGDITVNNTSQFSPIEGTTADDSKVILNGTGTQTIGGNSTALVPVNFMDLVINKPTGTEVVMATNVSMGLSGGGDNELTFTSGILNLGSQTLTVYSEIITRHTGIIDGSTGTYVISTGHHNNKLEDVYFTVNGTPTLYNLTVNAAHTTANDLTVNGTLNLNTADLTIGSSASSSAPIKLILNGNLTRTAAEIAGSTTLSRLVLQGTGTVANGLSNTYFEGGTATTVQLEIARQETLGGNLTIANTSYLRINTGINTFDLGTNTLTFTTTFNSVILSGGIDADAGTVSIPDVTATIPASMFFGNTIKNLTLLSSAKDITLAGDLTITGTLTRANAGHIITNDNLLTFGPDAILPSFTDSKHIIGNLKRTVKSTATVFSLGNGSSLMPVTLKFANGGSEQLITTSITQKNPVYGRGGNANNAIELEWNFAPEGTAPTDSLNAIFTWVTGFDGGTTPLANTSFPAKWMQTYWKDYRNNLMTFTPATPRVLTMALSPIQSSSDLAGTWAVFTATANTNTAKDAAIATNKNKVVIKNINPLPILKNSAFKLNVELQDQFGRAILLSTPFAFTITQSQGGGTFATTNGIIPAGQSSVTLSGLVFTASGINNQLLVDSTGSSDNWNPGLSVVFSVLPTMPATQAHTIVLSNVTATSMTIGWQAGGATNEIIVIKADTLLTETEYPIGGTTYYANSIMGAGSSLGGASVVYNGTGNEVNVSGLSPNTKYYVYAFNYDMDAAGNERYRTTAASGNPKSATTTGSYDDDATLGTNNTRETSKTIGTNTPVYGTIKTADDVDWFNFTVTSASPNVRGTLVLTSDMGNYDMELYNGAGRRIRRGIRISNNTEAQVINDLPAGTYTVKVMGDGTAYNSTSPYKLKVTTSNSEIFSVTP